MVFLGEKAHWFDLVTKSSIPESFPLILKSCFLFQIFHVCALTDDGLIMKSFLCPESTLFDQTVLKCNWFFYVECKNSKKLYDSNIPISKSYQLMKALTFFSSYKKDVASTTAETIEKDWFTNLPLVLFKCKCISMGRVRLKHKKLIFTSFVTFL